MAELALGYLAATWALSPWLQDWELSLYLEDDLDNREEVEGQHQEAARILEDHWYTTDARNEAVETILAGIEQKVGDTMAPLIASAHRAVDEKQARVAEIREVPADELAARATVLKSVLDRAAEDPQALSPSTANASMTGPLAG